MKLNPQAIINAGSVSGGCSGGGIQIGTNVPSGIKNTHRFENEEARDEYFTEHFPELERLKTIIVCGEKLQLWTGKTAQSPYDNSKWVDMTWVIQGEQGIPGEKGENGRGIARIEANLSEDDRNWTLEVTYSDGTQESLVFPVPEVLANVAQRLSAIEVKWTTTNPINNLDVTTSPGRYPVGDATYGKPPMMANKGSADVYVVDGSILQVVRSIDGGVYSRIRHNGAWREWNSQSGEGSGGGGLNGDQEAMLTSLGKRLPEISPETLDLNTLTKQGRFCYFEGSANRPNGTQTHGSVDVHACKDHVLQIATSIDGVMYHRSYTKRTDRWTEWLQISDHTGGATIYAFPRVSSVFTTAQNLIEVTNPGTGNGSFYIPWKYVIHDNYGCTPQIKEPQRQEDADHWWVAPKSGSYDMELLFDIGFIKTQQTIPPIFVVTAWHRTNEGNERLAARYNIGFDVSTKNQKTKSLKLRLNQIPSGEMFRWQVTFSGGSWSSSDNPDVSLVPFRTLLMVDEVEHDTAKRVGALAYNTWANFQAKKGLAATVGEDDMQKARLNAVKWGAIIESVEATPQPGQQPVQ